MNHSTKSIWSVGESYININSLISSITVMVSLSTFFGIADFNALSPKSLAGLLIGGMLPFKVSSLILTALNETSDEMIEEIKT